MSIKRYPIVVNKSSWLFAVVLAFCIQLPAHAQSCNNYRWKTVTGVGTTVGDTPETVAYESRLPYYVIGHPNVTLNPFSCALQSGDVNLGTANMYCTSTYVCGPPSCTATQTGGVEANVWQEECPSDFFVRAKKATAEPTCCEAGGGSNPPTLISDPINPASGSVTKSIVDISSGTGGVAFTRSYDSSHAAIGDLGPAWHHSYTRRVVPVYTSTFFRPYDASDPDDSGRFKTAKDACETGFMQIRARINGWQAATASYLGGVCKVSVAGTEVGALDIYHATTPLPPPPPSILGYQIIRDDGQDIMFYGGLAPAGVTLKLSVVSGGYTLTDGTDNVETYDSSGILQSIASRAGVVQTLGYTSGRLSSVTNNFGRSIALAYDTNNKLASVSGDGATVQYAFDAQGRLATITNADGTLRTYAYTSPWSPNLLTGENDENATLFSSWTYDSSRRATMTEEAGGAGHTTLVYNGDGSVTVTDALGAVRTFSYSRVGERDLSTGITGTQCPSCAQGKATSYDAAGFINGSRDYNDNLTCFARDTRGLETVRVEGFAPATASCPTNLSAYSPAAGTRERKIVTAWHANFRVPTSITKSNQTVSFTHDANANVLTRTVTDTSVTPNVSRVWTYTYNSFGQVLTEDGPRTDATDVTTYAYYNCTTGYQCGQLNTITNALSQVTTYNSYNAHGQPTQITDANGLVTGLAYDARQRLTDRCTGGTLPGCSGGELTHLDYWPTGLLKKVTNPDASYIEYAYDNAHRLTQINDGALNKIVFTLDNAGNRKAENTYDPSFTLKRTHSRVFNTLSQLWKDVNAAGTANVTTEFGYDNNGNQITTSAPLARNSTSLYDELNRLKQITDPNSGNTLFGYDATDNLTSVTDPRTLVTSYTYNGFGDLKTQTSPDTGLSTNTFDSGGNLKTTTDARNAITTYTYDVMNRVSTAAFKIGSTTDQTITYTYDAGTNGKGHLTGASDANHALAWTYDAQGRINGKGQSFTGVTPVLSIGYGYNAQGQLFHIVLPSGKAITYGYNSNGQVSSVTLDGSPSTTLLNNVSYDPFGPITGWTWGNGTASTSRTFDTDGKLTALSSTATSVGNRTFGYDDAFRITSTTDSATSGPAWTLGYDLLDRLNSATKTGTTIGYSYDANGNRLTQTGTTASTYTVAGTSNRLSSATGGLTRTYNYNASGSVLTSGATTHTYYNSGRMKTGKLGAAATTTYVYNALGQRIKKSGGAISTAVYFMYDEAGHLVGEYNVSGSTVTPVQETVWLGDIPIATLRVVTGVTTAFYVHTDQLNTPRKVTNIANQLRWKWDPNPFGEGTPNENPASLGSFKYHLRFPGQYFDLETNLNYNYRRDYDPATGRFAESDPIGLQGGTNTFAYASANPVSNFDPRGLECASTGGFIYCIYPDGGPNFRFPTQPGFPDFLGGDDFWNFMRYHKYDESVPLGSASADCVMQKLIENPTPQGGKPATKNGTRNNAAVFGMDNWITSYLTSDLDTGAPIVVNTTDNNSAFYPGYVARTVRNGVAHTYGEGLALSQAVPGPQAFGNWFYWKRQMEKIVQECSCQK